MSGQVWNEGLVRAGLDQIDQGLTVIDRELRIVAWNRRFLELQDFPEEIVFAGAHFGDLVRYNAERGEYGPGDVEDLVAERVAQAEQFLPHDFERQRPNGVILRITGAPLPEGGFATVYTDVTKQKRREADLERRIADRTAELSESRARLSLIADEVPAGIAYLDAEQRFRFVNARFAKAYGRRPSELLGLRSQDVLDPATTAASQAFFDRAKQRESVDFDMPVALPDGRQLEVRTFLRPERATEPGAGDPVGFYVLSINMTRQKQADAALAQAQKMDALGALSSGVAHDFNNLLTVILGNLRPLEDRVEPELVDKMVAPAIRAARRGADLTRRLLAVARRQPLEPRATNIGEVIAGLGELLRPILPQSIDLRIATGGDLRPVFVDPSLLETALLNLAINARDALQGKGVISIRAENDPADALVRIVFEDDGPGVPPDLRQRVFEPFFTTKSEGRGVGLGLSMVYGFVEQSKGLISVGESARGGARFDIALPVAASGVAGANELGAKEIPMTARKGLALLVDDQAEVREVIRRDLMALGFPVIEAANAAEALKILRATEAITLVLTDLAMPGGMSGLDLAAVVHEEWPGLRIVLMTGQEIETPPARGPAPLRKPFDREALVQAIAEASMETS